MPSKLLKSKPNPDVKGWDWRFEAIGTHWDISVEPAADGRLPDELALPAGRQRLRRRVMDRIDSFDQTYSRFRSDSLVTAMANAAGSYRLPPDAAPLFELYQGLYRLTGGAVTPLIGQTLSDAGYDADYTLMPGTITPPPRWEDVMEYRAGRLWLRRPALLDFGAAGKGYLVDIICDLLAEAGLTEYCVDAGGDMRQASAGQVGSTGSARRLTVGLEHPAQADTAIGIVTLCNQSLCGSAGNRRSWAGYHHILDPFNLRSPRHIAALWVTAGSGLLADGLTTALFFMPPEQLAAEYDFGYAIMYNDSSLQRSDNFPAEFFTTQI